MAYDPVRYKAEARAPGGAPGASWAGWVIALALAMWAVFHFLLTRRTARLMRAAERPRPATSMRAAACAATTNWAAWAAPFDAMALQVTETQTRLREDIAERCACSASWGASDERLQQILNNSSRGDLRARRRGPLPVRQPRVGARVPDEVGRRRRLARQGVRGEARAASYRANNEQVLARNMTMVFEETLTLDDGLHTYISIRSSRARRGWRRLRRVRHRHRHH